MANLNKKEYKAKLEQLKKVDKMPKLKSDPERLLEFKFMLDQLFKVMSDYKLDYSMKWLQGLETYIHDKEDRANKFKKHLERGHVIQIELFGHYNKELTFEHPAVVLHDVMTDEEKGEGWVLAAPISTPSYGNNNPLHIDLEEEDGLRHACAARLDSIKVIDKKRILYQHTKNEQNIKIRSTKLDEIDMGIFENYLSNIFTQYNVIKTKLKEEIKEHEKTKLAFEMFKQQGEVAVTRENA